jgi:hypothetical protein
VLHYLETAYYGYYANPAFSLEELFPYYNFLEPFASRGGYKAMTLDRLKEKFEEFVGFDELGKKILPLE